jgi:Tfp pilus assembly protein PilN
MDWRALLRFGSGVGIEIRPEMLEVAVVKVRPAGVRVLGRLTIETYRDRPAAEWGAEYSALLRQCGAAHVSATVLLPRADVIVRQLSFPGVASRDLAAAIAYQLDSLHPYGDQEIASGWTRTAENAVIVGVIRRETLNRYTEMFAEAGIAVCSFTFTATALHAAIRAGLKSTGPAFLVFSPAAYGLEVYGENEARPVFSAALDMAPDRGLALAAAELRLPASIQPQPLDKVLPAPSENPVENDLSRNALPYATALAGACPRLAPAANLLPAELRSSNSRGMYIPTAVAAALLLIASVALLAQSAIHDRRYLRQLEAEIARLEPAVRRSAEIDRQITKARERAVLLDNFRARSRAELEALNELTRLLPPPVWANSIDMGPEMIILGGEAEQAAELVQVLDSSPLFHQSEMGMLARTGPNEVFRITTRREAQR